MKSRKFELILLTIAIAAILPVLVFVTSGFFDNDLVNTSTNEDHDDHVLFPTASGAESPVEVAHVFKSKVRGGDAVGNVSSFVVTDNYIDTSNHCEFCTRIDYTPGHHGVAGFSYLDKKGFDLTNAKRVTFFVMEESGNATVKMMVGGKDVSLSNSGSPLFADTQFAKTTKNIKLTNHWKKFEIDVSNSDLKNITHPFALEIKKGKDTGKIVLYVKYVLYDTQAANNPVATEKT